MNESALLKYANSIGLIKPAELSETHWLGYPVYVTEYIEPGRVYATADFLFTDSLDTIVKAMVINDVREEAKRIVQWGLSDIRAWVGEIPPEDVRCDCIPIEMDAWSHTVGDHADDCWYPPPCGGCYGCLAKQYWYYKSLGADINAGPSDS